MATLPLHTITGALMPRPPFDFAKTHSFLRGFSPIVGEQAFTVVALTKAVTIQGQAVAFTLSDAGTIEAPKIAYSLASERPLSQAEQAAVEDRISFFLSLDDDLQPFYALGRADPSFAPVIERFNSLHQPKFLTPFEIACWAVLGQRIPMRIAHRTKLALVERWGTSITLPDGETYRAFTEPAQLAEVAPDDLLAVVKNERKVEYLQAVTQFFSKVDESFLRSGPYEEVVARLRGIRGIGEWSSHFILVRGLGRMERVSVVDRELLKAASKLYNHDQPLDTAAMQRVLDYYGPTQGYWAYYARIAVIEKFAEMGM